MKMAAKLTSNETLHFFKPTICFELGYGFSVSWHETKIRQKRAAKTNVDCQNKTDKSVTSSRSKATYRLGEN